VASSSISEATVLAISDPCSLIRFCEETGVTLRATGVMNLARDAKSNFADQFLCRHNVLSFSSSSSSGCTLAITPEPRKVSDLLANRILDPLLQPRFTPTYNHLRTKSLLADSSLFSRTIKTSSPSSAKSPQSLPCEKRQVDYKIMNCALSALRR
jgi:hypothetical protein